MIDEILNTYCTECDDDMEMVLLEFRRKEEGELIPYYKCGECKVEYSLPELWGIKDEPKRIS